MMTRLSGRAAALFVACALLWPATAVAQAQGETIIPVEGLPESEDATQKEDATKDETEPQKAEAAEKTDEEKAKEDKEAAQRRREAQNRAIALANAGALSAGFKRGWQWDLNVDLGIGNELNAGGLPLMARVRSGITRIQDPLFLTLSPTVDISNVTPLAFGLQAELLSIQSGLQVQLGGAVNIEATPSVHAALGWQIFAVEAQAHLTTIDEPTVIIYGKLRIPISWLIIAFSR